MGILLCLQEYSGFSPEGLLLTELTPEIKQTVEISGIDQYFTVITNQEAGYRGERS